jgi:hypothetical protein
LVRLHAAGSRTRKQFGAAMTIGFFNWTDAEQVTSVNLAQFGLDPQRIALRDFWTNEAKAATGTVLTIVLPARGHAIMDVIPQ